jgi:hypothetical protein
MKRLSMKKTYIGVAVGAVLVALIVGSLYVTSPTIPQLDQERIACRPLGPGFAGNIVLNGFPSYSPALEGADALAEWGRVGDDETFDMRTKLGVSEACEQARTNRFVGIVLWLAAGLAALILALFSGLARELLWLRGGPAEQMNATEAVEDSHSSHEQATSQEQAEN